MSRGAVHARLVAKVDHGEAQSNFCTRSGISKGKQPYILLCRLSVLSPTPKDIQHSPDAGSQLISSRTLVREKVSTPAFLPGNLRQAN